MNPLMLLALAGGALMLAGRRSGGIRKCFWTDEYRGYCYHAHAPFLGADEWGYVVRRSESEEPLIQTPLIYVSRAAAEAGARAWIDTYG